MNTRLVRLSVLIVLSAALLFFTSTASPAHAARINAVSMTTLGTPITQNFDTLASVASTTNTWTDDSTLPGWFAQFTTTTNPTTYRSDSGGSNAGAIYSWGVAGTNALTERAFGAISSGTPVTIFFGIKLTNDTGSAITSLDIAYTGEQWRQGGCSPTPCTPVAQKDDFQYQVANASTITDANSPSTGWTDYDALDFTSPSPGTSTAAAIDGNAASNRTALSSTINVTVNPGQEVWLRWQDINDAGNDHGLAVDDFSVTPHSTLTLNINDVSLSEGDAGTTSFNFTVSLSEPAPAGGVTFDIGTADNTATQPSDYTTKSLTGQSISAGNSTYPFSVLVNGDTTAEIDDTFFVNVTNVSGAAVGDGQGTGTILNDDLGKIHDVQGNGAASPFAGSTAIVEGVVVADFQGSNQLKGFFLEEEDADADADPATSEGIFVFCSSCPTAVAEGQRVKVTGTVSEFNNMTEITASSAGSVVVTDAGNHLAEVTAASIDLPIVGVIDDYYEAREGMLVTFPDQLTVSEYFELARYGQIVLTEGGRLTQFTETNPPNVAGYNAHLDNVARREIILDDDNNTQESFLSSPDGSQFIYHPVANGGFSVGTQGTDFFRGGDLVNNLTGVLQWSFPGFGAETWRIRPTAAHPVTFTPTNLRPATPPSVPGAIHAVGMNLLNYFTTIDTTSSTSSGPCGPSGTLDCRGADSVAELNRQRERASIVICSMNADVYGFMELENTTPSDTITDLLGAVNARCGGANPYTFVNTGGTLGTDAIRVELIYRTGILSPVGSPLVDLDPVHNRPPTAQTFDVVDPANDAFGERFTVIANHFKSKGCPGTGADADQGDGQSCFAGTRTAQATRLLTWINSTVIPAAGDPDVLLLGDFNSYAKETPITTIESGGYTDIESALLGPNAYSYLFDAELGHLDYAFANSTLNPKVTGVGIWHINADEVPVFDYNDEVFDSPGEASFDEKPDGSALVPPRVVFQPASPYRASDHDPVLVGLFAAPTQAGPNFVVNSAADTDDGSCDLPGQGIGNKDCTLREAINAANALAGADTITFDIPNGGACSAANICTITLGSQLPAINDDVTIDGSQNSADITLTGGSSDRVLLVNSGKNATLDTLTIADSTCVCDGVVRNEGTLTVKNSTFSNNTANGPGSPGGAIQNYSGTLNVVNSTFSGNTANGSGGAIENNGTLNVTNSTLSGNTAGNGGGGIANIGTATLKNTIVAGNAPADCSNTATLSADAFNLDSDGSCDSSTQKTVAQIALAALADNGGPTQTMALGNSSVAIDVADPTVCADTNTVNNLDQRGKARNDLQCDVGAFEFVNSDGHTVINNDLTTGETYTFGPTLAQIQLASGNPGTLTVNRELTPPVNSPPANALPISWDAHDPVAVFSVVVTLCYDKNVLTGQNENTLHVYHYNGTSWDDLGGTLDTVNHAPYHCITASTPLNNLSPLAIAPAATTAVNVKSFTAHVGKIGNITLRWRTTSESQIAGFNIYRKNGQGEWKQINTALVPAKHSGDLRGAKYAFKDRDVRAAKTYRYKLEVIYLDQHAEWTDVVKIVTP